MLEKGFHPLRTPALSHEQVFQHPCFHFLTCYSFDFNYNLSENGNVSSVIKQQLPGLLSLSTKLLPTVMNLLRKLAEEGQTPSKNSSQTSMHSSAQSEVTTNGESSSSGSSPAKNVPIDTSA
ncbi:unnamed protein product [Microthlaspi erraticum]|uniref:Uncharacterized protein n=1 Tax=Microthlaspi erraticum TaxID=1685480 RepID=A0A6D2HKU9_9BRAS|nr:unnamed protein product [Microthlaspi erraticum]